jgi:HD-GYP domain-containing protein (c-di-GMP phosphodiesterase class II)
MAINNQGRGRRPAEGLDPETHVLIEGARRRRRRPLSRREWIASLVSGGTLLAVSIPLAALSSSDRSVSIGTTLALVAAYAVASQIEFEVGAGWAVPTQLILVPMFFVLPVASVPLLVAGGMVAGDLGARLLRGQQLERLVVVPGNAWHALGPALVLAAAGERSPRWSDWALYLGALGAQFACDFGNSALRERIAFGVSPHSQLRFFGSIWTADAALAPVGLGLAFLSVDHPYAFLLALPLVGLLAVFARQRRASIDNAAALGSAYRGTAFLLADVIEAEDAYTGAHSRDVVELVRATVEALGLDAGTQGHAELAALLHDVGKIRLPNEVLNKRGALTPEERTLINLHTIEGEKMLSRVGGLLGEIGLIIRSCHEHWDGAGYPDGLAGEEIPVIARIVACCDAYNAMTTDRPYRRALSPEYALEELRANAGTQFDPEVVSAFLRVVARQEPVHVVSYESVPALASG